MISSDRAREARVRLYLGPRTHDGEGGVDESWKAREKLPGAWTGLLMLRELLPEEEEREDFPRPRIQIFLKVILSAPDGFVFLENVFPVFL